MSRKITFESIVKFCEYDLLLKLDTLSINVEFYSLSNSFYFIILCHIEQKIYLFVEACNFKILMLKKFWPPGNYYWLLRVSTLKVKV